MSEINESAAPVSTSIDNKAIADLDNHKAVVPPVVVPAKSKSEMDFERRMQTIGAKDLELKQREDKLSKYEKHQAVLDAIDSGDPVAIAKAVYTDRFNLETLTLLANQPEILEPKEFTVEERVDRVLAAKEAERKASEDKLRKEADTKAYQDGANKLEHETKEYLKEAKSAVVANKDKYPFFIAFDDEADHEAMILAEIQSHLDETATKGEAEVLDPEEAIQRIEARYAKIYGKTPFATKTRQEPTFDDELDRMARQAAIPRSPKAPPKTLDEQIIADLAAHDAAKIQQSRRFTR